MCIRDRNYVHLKLCHWSCIHNDFLQLISFWNGNFFVCIDLGCVQDNERQEKADNKDIKKSKKKRTKKKRRKHKTKEKEDHDEEDDNNEEGDDNDDDDDDDDDDDEEEEEAEEEEEESVSQPDSYRWNGYLQCEHTANQS